MNQRERLAARQWLVKVLRSCKTDEQKKHGERLVWLARRRGVLTHFSDAIRHCDLLKPRTTVDIRPWSMCNAGVWTDDCRMLPWRRQNP